MATIRWWKLALLASVVAFGCGFVAAQQTQPASAIKTAIPPNRQHSARFLAQRSLNRSNGIRESSAELLMRARAQHALLKASSTAVNPLNAPWTSLGPSAVQTSAFGLISGRVTSLAVDPSDASGNTVYVGTTGGGVWRSTNAAGPAGSATFTPLTDTLPVSAGCTTPPLISLSIGALTVQPGGTGVILAGTGDPNDSLDSYYGSGILRSADGGNTWCLISSSQDAYNGALRSFSFLGEGFAGFAWSTVNTQLVVAAVAESVEGVVVHAGSSSSFAGLYYSTDAGKTWLLATIEDGPQQIIQSSQSAPPGDPGNPATSVTWNPIRKRFYAAVQYHGYYESLDGITWTRLTNQPGANLSTAQCPDNLNGVGYLYCPIFRGTITSQPVTGDLFAITVDNNNKDQGLWQDVCNAGTNGCASATVTFSKQIADTAVDTGANGTAIPQGDYDLSLAAVPSQQDTLLFVGTRDIFRCSLANSCAWRNTTNVNGCVAAQVSPSQHVFDATFGANGLMYFGNDGGLWRTTDAVNQQQPTCSADDAAHFQNLNGGIGSLAEIGDFSQHPQDQNALMAAMGAFGTAAPQNGGSTWTQILDGEGDYNAIDPENPQNWYATSAAPVAINHCTQGTACNETAFGLPVIGNSQVGDDGYGLTETAPWILDPQNSANMVIGTCRVWRGSANGSAWSANNAISPMLDGIQNSYCSGNAQIRSLAASGTPGDAPGAPEKIYAGMTGADDGGATVAGHIYTASVSSEAGVVATWSDLSNAPVLNNPQSQFNSAGFDVSSVYVDPHDSTGNTVYVTLQGFITGGNNGSLIYRSVDGGAHWIAIAANLPNAPANSILVDPNDANTVYVALDTGTYVTRNINLCTDTSQNCWSIFGTGLPNAPVMQLSAVNYSSISLLRAATYGRGIWQIPLLTAGTATSAATLTPATLTFASQKVDSLSSPQTITVQNTSPVTLAITSITASPNFAEQNQCTQPLAQGDTCTVQVSFAPAGTGPLQGVLTVYGNVPTGQVTAALSGVGLAAGNILLQPLSLNFGNSLIGQATSAQNITISNTGGISVNLQSPTITGDFQISANTCGGSLAPNYGCTISVIFTPAVAGGRTGVLSVSDDTGTQAVQLSGNGQAAATAVLSGTSLHFSQPQTVGTKSIPQQITLTNNGDVSLTDISIAVSGDFTAQNNCGSFLIGHATCAISVIYVPTQVGPESGALAVNTQFGVQTVALSGTGLAPAGISALPTTLNFGEQAVGSVSSPQRVVLTNNGGSPLTGLTFGVNGDFKIAGSNCSSGQTLGSPGTCYIDLTFSPTQAGPRSGSLTVDATNIPSPLNIAVTGAGEDFQVLVSGPSSAVIVNGQSATYTAQVVSVNGSSGTLTMGCTGVPQNATCTVNPMMLPVTGGSTGFATVTVVTGISSASSSATSSFVSWKKISIALAALLPCIFVRFRKSNRSMRGWPALLVVLLLLVPIACGTHATGGSTTPPSSPPQGPTTPSGVYTLTITAAIPGLQKNVPVTLTIQ